MSDDRYADHDAAMEKDMQRFIDEDFDRGEAEMLDQHPIDLRQRLAGDEMPEWVERVRNGISPKEPHRTPAQFYGHDALAALDSIVELYEWTEAAREQLNIDRIHEKRRGQKVVEAAQRFLQLTHGDSEQKRALVLALDHYAYDRESGAAGPANEASHSTPAVDDTAAPERPTLFDQLPDPGDDRLGRFSSGSPDTQRTAAVKIYPKTGTQRRKVLDTLALDDLTDEQIESRIHIGQRQVSTRRKELEMDGWITDSEVRRTSRAGFEVVVWTLTAQGRDQYPGLDS